MGASISYHNPETEKLRKQIDQLQGPCPDKFPVFLPYGNEYFCYQQKVEELNSKPELVCSMFGPADKIDPKFDNICQRR